jgi:molybdate transport system regulatory protein
VSSEFPEIRFRVDFDGCSVGIGKIRLLEAVERTGSLSQAARAIAMSYRRAWLLIDSMNSEFDIRVVSASVGGSGGGGAKVTSFGKTLIEAYRELETRLAPLTTDCMGEVAKHAVVRRGRTVRPPSRKSIARPLKHSGSR